MRGCGVWCVLYAVLCVQLKLFKRRVQQNLHVVMCFTPSSDLRNRAKRFPALVSCSSIDWFHAWSREALISVAAQFVSDVTVPSEDLRDSLSHHLCEAHTAVVTASQTFLREFKRYNYATPTSFLEYIQLFKHLLRSKSGDMRREIERLQSGLTTMQRTRNTVDTLKEDLRETMVG